MNIYLKSRAILLAVGALALMPAAGNAATHETNAPCADPPYAAGSFCAIMSVKMPGLYGPHLAAADLPPRDLHRPAPGSWQAIMAVKDPSHYGPHLPAPSSFAALQARRLGTTNEDGSAVVPQADPCSTAYPAPGSFEALMRAKNMTVRHSPSGCK